MRIKRFFLLAFFTSIFGVACSINNAEAFTTANQYSVLSSPISTNSNSTSLISTIPTSNQPVLTLTPTIPPPQPAKRLFDEFIDAIKNGDKKRIVGIYVENKLALRVIYQPANDPGFVSSNIGVATYFLLPYTVARNHGFLAHNFLSGGLFFGLKLGDIVQVIWGDGSYDDFEILKLREFQALSPNSTKSDFIDLSTGEKVNANTLFIEIYKGKFHIALQTCISRDNEGSWGRLFILAPPAN
jgi:hypothetical protein